MSNPIQPLALPRPTVVHQTTQITCWAACLRSLNQTNGSSINHSEAEWAQLFQQFLRPRGINTAGLNVATQVHGMHCEIIGGGRLNLQHIRDGLQNGYVVLGFVFPHPSITPPEGHVVVVYGVSPRGVQVMNPDPEGALFLDTAFLKTCPRLVIATYNFPTRATNPFAGMVHAPVY